MGWWSSDTHIYLPCTLSLSRQCFLCEQMVRAMLFFSPTAVSDTAVSDTAVSDTVFTSFVATPRIQSSTVSPKPCFDLAHSSESKSKLAEAKAASQARCS